MNRITISLEKSPAAVALAFGVILEIGMMASLSIPVFAADSAKKLFALGQSEEARENYDAAFEDYRMAFDKAPGEVRIRATYFRMRQTVSALHVSQGRKLVLLKDDKAALLQFQLASEIDPGNEAATQEIARIRTSQAQKLAGRIIGATDQEHVGMKEDAEPPVRLKPVSNNRLTLHMTEDAKVVYEAIGKAAGVNVLFDPDYSSKRIEVDLTDVSLINTLRIVGTISNSFWQPVTDNTIFVAQNSRTKRAELEELAEQTFYLSNIWQQNDLNDVQTALRNVLPNAKVYGLSNQNAIVMRASPDELVLAQKLIDDIDKARPEVVVDFAIMEVDKDKMRNIGLSWPGSIGFALQPPQSTSGTSTPTNPTTGSTTTNTGNLTLENFSHLNANSFAVTVSAATANLMLSDNESSILQNPRLRSVDGQKATMKVGSRIPIATGSYQTGAATALVSSLVNTQFQYIDVGVNIELTPTVHADNDVTLKLKIEDSSDSNNVTISGVSEPVIAQKTSEQTIRLREGEASIISGILDKQDLVSITGIPGLGELPLFRYIFGSRSHQVIDDEIVFVVIPHVVRGLELSPANTRPVDTGTGQAIEIRRAGQAEIENTKPAQVGSPAAGTQPQPSERAE